MKHRKRAGLPVAWAAAVLLALVLPRMVASQSADSLLAHYPMQTGNAWDYDADVPFLWGSHIPPGISTRSWATVCMPMGTGMP